MRRADAEAPVGARGELSLDDVVIRLIETGRGHAAVPAIEAGVATLLKRGDEGGFELDDLLAELRRSGHPEVAEWTAAAVEELVRMGGPLTVPRAPEVPPPPAADAEGFWTHPVYGYRFRFPESDHYVAPGLVAGWYESYESELFASLVRPDDVVLDVGANLGHYTLLAAQRVDPARGGRVVAFEPGSENFAYLRENVAANGAAGVVRAVRAAVGERSGRATLRLSGENNGDHRVLPRGAAVPEEHRASERVRVVELDGFCAAEGIVPTLVKVDTQGHELYVLRGMRRLLESRTPLRVILEFAPEHSRVAGADPRELYDLAARCFDELYVVDEPGRGLAPATWERVLAECARHEFTNLLGVVRAEGGSER